MIFHCSAAINTIKSLSLCPWKTLHRDPVHLRKSLKQQYLLVNAEPMQDHHEIFPTARDLTLHGQAEIFFHSFSYTSGNCVMP